MQINEQAVRERAYYIWEGEGRVHGQAEAHWLRAETELSAVAPAKKAVRTPARKAEGAQKVATLAAKAAPASAPKAAQAPVAKAKPAAPVSTARKAAKPKAIAEAVAAASAGKAKPARARAALH